MGDYNNDSSFFGCCLDLLCAYCSSDTEGTWASRRQGLRPIHGRAPKECNVAKSNKSPEERGEF